MSTTKASPTVPMPVYNIHTVRVLFREAQMSDRDFRVFTTTIKHNASKCLDNSGFVSIEEQDPTAFRRFLDEVKRSDPSIAPRYPYLWPVLAYLELYLRGRRYRSHLFRDTHGATNRLTRRNATSHVPIWVRFARSEKTGRPLREIEGMRSNKLPSHAWYVTHQRTYRQRPTREIRCKREPAISDSEAAESITSSVLAVDNSPADPPNGVSHVGPSSGLTPPVKSFWQSVGSSVGAVCAHFVVG